MLEIFLTAIALVLVIEGILPFAAPSVWRDMMSKMAERDTKTVRKTGFVILLLGVVLMVLVHTGLL
jgi:uncharacterized protein